MLSSAPGCVPGRNRTCRHAALPGRTPALNAGKTPARNNDDLPIPEGPIIPTSVELASRATTSETTVSRPQKYSASERSKNASPLNGHTTPASRNGSSGKSRLRAPDDPERLRGSQHQRRTAVVAILGCLRKPGSHHDLEPGQCRRRLFQMREQHRRIRRPRERRCAHQTLVQQAGKRILIGAAVDLLAADLLRRGVVDRPKYTGSAACGSPRRFVNPKSARYTWSRPSSKTFDGLTSP